MRKLWIVFALIAGLLVVAVAGVWVLANPNRHREYIQGQLEKQLARKVQLGEMSLGFLPLRFEVKQPVISEDPSLGQQPFVKAESLNIQISLLSLLRGSIEIDSLELQKPRVELIRTKKGVWNFSTVGAEANTGISSSNSPSPKNEPEFSLEQLRIADGQIGITDLQHNRPRAGYDHIDLTVRHFSKHKPFEFDLAARIEGDAGQEVRLKGEAGPVSASNPSDTPFRGTLAINKVGVENLMMFLQTGAITKAKGTLSGQSEVASQSGKVSATGQLKLDGAQVNDVAVGYPVSADYKLSTTLADGLVTIENATLHLGSTPLTLAGTLKTAATPPVIDVTVKSGDASITELARLASAFGAGFAPGTSVNGRVRADIRVKGPASKPALNGTITGTDLAVSGPGIPQPVQVKSLDLTLTPTAIRSNEFTATSGMSRVTGQFALLQYASDAPALDLALRSPGATLPEIQSLTKAYGITGLNQLTGEGNLNFDLKAKGLVETLSKAAAVKALNGVINLDFSPIKIAGFDTAHELGKLGGFASSLTEHNETDILHMTGRIDVKDGIAQTDSLHAQLGIGNVTAGGTADLLSESLNMKVAAVFTKEFSEKVGATRAGGLMNAALTNAAGELVLPAIITGNFQHPKFAPDLKAVATLQKQKYLPNLVDALTGKTKAAGDDAPQDGKKTSTVKGILDLFGRKKEPSK